jgi:hypothetical protein
MPRLRFLAPLVATACLVLAAAAWAQNDRDPSRDVFLQTIGMLAGQGLVLGHENLEGLCVRYDKRLLPRDQALSLLADAGRYTDWVLATFKERLMARLDTGEQQDLTLLIGFYELQHQAIEALAVYVRSGSAKNRENFQNLQDKVAAVIGRISLGGRKP